MKKAEAHDRLHVVHLKLWHLEDKMRKPGISNEDAGIVGKQIAKLNDERNTCIGILYPGEADVKTYGD